MGNKTLSKRSKISEDQLAETLGRQQPYRDKGCELYTQELHNHLSKTLVLPAEAVQWLIDVWKCIQLFDDVADGDEVDRKDLNSVIWATFIGLHSNPFFEAKKAALLPVLATQILKWQASDWVERNKMADARSFVWRAGYYDLVLFCVHLCHGQEVATTSASNVLSLYGESFEGYLKEFANA